jgi:hypothetical protein
VRIYRLDIHIAPGVIGLGWDRAADYPIRDSITFEVPDDQDGADRADDIMAERGCPDERGLLWWVNHPHGEQIDVTISGEDVGLVRCGHPH